MKKTLNLAKSVIVYFCSLIISMGLGAWVASHWIPNLGVWVYLPIVIIGLALGFLANKQISGILGIAVLVGLAIVAFIVGDMAMHSFNGNQHSLRQNPTNVAPFGPTA